ncbi:MAG: hypothetical protein KBS61_05060, partial [Chryseobacterium sp.]|nr:hypothetical protein [Candidatus Chryseobacterium enterohippi]
MNSKIIQIITVLSFVGVAAQTNDSIFVPKNQLYYKQYDKIWDNPIQFSQFKIKDFTETELSATLKEGNFRRAQNAESSNQFEFKTQGIFNIAENLRVLGSFDYQFVTEKQVGFNLTSDRTEDQFLMNPHYIFVPKKGNWESQKYNLMGGISYTLSNFDFGATANYRNNNSVRKSDPRPQINTADYSGKLFAGYHLGKHQVSIFGGLGRKSDAYDVDYLNKLNNSPSNPDYYMRFSDGYGRLLFFKDFSNFNYKTIDRNFGAGYAYQGKNHHFNINYSYSKTMQT